MNKVEFLIGSLAVHVVLLIFLLLLPPPFPSGSGTSETGLTYVEVHQEGSGVVVPGPAEEQSQNEAEPEAKPEEKTASAPEAKSLQAGNVGREAGRVSKAQSSAMPKERTAPEARRVTGREAAKAEAPPNRNVPAPKAPPPPPAPVPSAQQARQAPAPAPVTAPAQATPAIKQPAPENKPPEKPAQEKQQTVALAAAASAVRGLRVDRPEISFKRVKGWPVPPMVRVKVEAIGPSEGAGGPWKADDDADWIILSPRSGSMPGSLKIGVDTSKLTFGFYEAKVTFTSPGSEAEKKDIGVTLMVLPKVSDSLELPHSAFDRYMNGDCKVCHLPKNVMPSPDFMIKPEFCALCHNPDGMAKDKVPRPGGHPMLVAEGSDGTKMPSHGTVPTGPDSDRMDTHLAPGGLITCVTCHNVMEKPGEYARSWELASSSDRLTYSLYGGGWENMGEMKPRVYVTPKLMNMPKHLQDAKKYMADPSSYTYDEEAGAVTFRKPRGKFDSVYVTLTNPYLRVTTENNALCYDCHNMNTHQGLNCLACHRVHGGGNIKGIRSHVRLPGMEPVRVVFRAKDGPGSFADGDGVYDGICEVCHTSTRYYRAGGGPSMHADGRDYSGTDCTRCHTHKNGFGI